MQVSVEELALQHFRSEEGGGWRGWHCEGGVWTTLFGLLCWDILFSSGVDDVFRWGGGGWVWVCVWGGSGGE